VRATAGVKFAKTAQGPRQLLLGIRDAVHRLTGTDPTATRAGAVRQQRTSQPELVFSQDPLEDDTPCRRRNARDASTDQIDGISANSSGNCDMAAPLARAHDAAREASSEVRADGEVNSVRGA